MAGRTRRSRVMGRDPVPTILLSYASSMPRAPIEVDAESVATICERYGIARLDVFGSVARGDADAESDIDVLYELAPGTHLGWNIENLADELTAVLGRPVDLVSRSALHQRIRDRVLSEARLLYAA